MSEKHSFFLPDLEYLIDLEGLLKYLGAKIGQGHLCIWCNEKKSAFLSLDSVRKHMQVSLCLGMDNFGAFYSQFSTIISTKTDGRIENSCSDAKIFGL